VDDTTVRTVVGSGHLGERSAMELRRDPDRLDDARRLRPGRAGTLALDRLAELASRLLGTPAGQVSVLTDVQLVAAGTGLAPGAVGSEGPLEDSLCTVTAAGTGALVVADAWADERVRDLPPVASRQIGAYLGVPLTGHAGTAIGALCVFGPEPRAWSETDITTLRQLAESAVTELELSALVEEFEADRVRWGLAIDAAGIGTFDWDLVTGRLSWDDRSRHRTGAVARHPDRARRPAAGGAARRGARASRARPAGGRRRAGRRPPAPAGPATSRLTAPSRLPP
jgi:hypothetical protein